MKKTGLLKVALLVCIAVGILLLSNAYTTKADTTSSGSDESAIILSLSEGDIDIYPTGYMQGNLELIPYNGKYIITGERVSDTPLDIINDTDNKVTYDVTLRDAKIVAQMDATAVRIKGQGETVINLYNEGDSTIGTMSNHQPLRAGTDNITVNTYIIDGSLKLYSDAIYGLNQYYIYSPNITFNSEVEVNNQDKSVTIKHESKDGVYTLDEENGAHIFECKNCNKTIKEKHRLVHATKEDDKYHKGTCSVCNEEVVVEHKYGGYSVTSGIYTKTCTSTGCGATSEMTLDISGIDRGGIYEYGKTNTVTSSTAQIVNMDYDEIRYQWYETYNENGTDKYRLLEGQTGPNMELPHDKELGEYRYRLIVYVDGVKGTYDATIKVVPVELQVYQEDIIYGEKLNPIATSGAYKVKYLYKQKDASNDTYTEKEPKDVGEYTVKAIVEDDTHFTQKEVTHNFTIAPRTIKVKWGETKLVYNGKKQHPEVIVDNIITGDSYNLTISGAQKKAGRGYEAKIEAIDNPNYALPTEGLSVTFEIVGENNTIQPTDDIKDQDEDTSVKNKDKTTSVKNKIISGDSQKQKIKTPGTSDTLALERWICIMIVSGVAVILLKRYKKI